MPPKRPNREPPADRRPSPLFPVNLFVAGLVWGLLFPLPAWGEVRAWFRGVWRKRRR